MSLIYKTLFEIKLLHEFYVTKTDGVSIFETDDQPGRMDFLLKQFSEGAESISNDLIFEFPASLEEEYKSYHLKLLPAYSGLKVATRVNKKILANGSLVYEPFTPLPENYGIDILISKRRRSMDGYTSGRIANPLPALYLFSNETIVSDRLFPFLTNTISSFRSGYEYEQGELASFGTNDVRGYYLNDDGDQWHSFRGTGFANESDRLLLPLKFPYAFPSSREVTEVQFTLKNKGGITIKSIAVQSQAKIEKVSIDFSDVGERLLAPATALYSDFIFFLEVSGNDGYTNRHLVFFNGSFLSRSLWGLVNIRPKTSDTAFDLFAADGYLKKRTDALGNEISAPIFEIPVKSRFTYWRYINDRGKELKDNTDLNGYLIKEDKMLVSARPRSIAQCFFKLQKEGSTEKKYFPNPLSYDVKRDSNGRLCFDIRVPRSDLFDIVP
jgi:hypothetical protein